MSELTHDPFDTREQPQAPIPAPRDEAREIGGLGTSPAEAAAYDRIYSVIDGCDAISLDRYLAEYRSAVLAAAPRADLSPPKASDD